MLTGLKIIPVTDANFDEQKLAPLLKKSQSEGYNLVLRMAENWANGSNRFDKPGEAFFAAEHEGRWLGIGGRSQDPYLDDPTVIRVRHVFILQEWRHCGIGTELMKKILDIPPGQIKRVTLRTLNPVARKFYEHLGFEPVDDGGPVTHQMKL